MALLFDTLQHVPLNGGVGTTLVASAVAGKRHKVLGFVLGASATGTFKFIDGAGDLMGPVTASKDNPVVTMGGFPIVETAINSPLSIVTTGLAARGVVVYVTEG